VKTRN